MKQDAHKISKDKYFGGFQLGPRHEAQTFHAVWRSLAHKPPAEKFHGPI